MHRCMAINVSCGTIDLVCVGVYLACFVNND